MDSRVLSQDATIDFLSLILALRCRTVQREHLTGVFQLAALYASDLGEIVRLLIVVVTQIARL